MVTQYLFLSEEFDMYTYLQYLLSLENAMFSGEETSIPVYLADYSAELEEIIGELAYGTPESLHDSALDALVNSISANGYQIVVSGGSPVIMSDAKIATVHGYLSGYGQQDGKIQTIAIVAHYDSLGIAPVSENMNYIFNFWQISLFYHFYFWLMILVSNRDKIHIK